MGWLRRNALALPTLVVAGCYSAASAYAVPITAYGNVDRGSDHVAASGILSGPEGTPPTFLLDPAPTKTGLSIAPFEISFRRADEGWVALLNGDPAETADWKR